MREFALAALPWICIGAAVAIFAVKHAVEKNKDDEAQETYMTEGMCLGLCVGVSLGSAAMAPAMLVGLLIGMHIKK